MERLAWLIGLAPSERTPQELREKVVEIHRRVVEGLESGARAWGEKKKASLKKVTKTMEAKKLEAETGMSLKDIEAKLKKLKELEAAQKEVMHEDRKLACQQDEAAQGEREKGDNGKN